MRADIWLVNIRAAEAVLQGDPPTVHETSLLYATHELITGYDDNPRLRVIPGRLRPPTLGRLLLPATDGRLGSKVQTALSEVDLENADRFMDDVLDTYILNDRPVTVSRATVTRDEHGWDVLPTLADFQQVYSGVVRAVTLTRGGQPTVRLRVETDRSRMDRPLSRNTYDGTGDEGGSEELTGQTKPIALGRIEGASPQLTDPFRLIYQQHDGAMLEISAVYDGGILLRRRRECRTYAQLKELVTEAQLDPDDPLAPAPQLRIGEYATCLDTGHLRLGGQPARDVTVDCRGHGAYVASQLIFTTGYRFTTGFGFAPRPGPAYAGRSGALIRRVLLDYAEVPGAEVDDDSFLDFDAEHPWGAGWYEPAGGNTRVGQVIERLAEGIVSVASPEEDGQWRLTRLRIPEPAECITVERDAILRGSMERLDPAYGSPWPKLRVGGRRCWSPGIEIAPGANESRKSFYARELEFSELANATLQALFPGGKVGELQTTLEFNAWTAIVAGWLMELYGPRADGRLPTFRRLTVTGMPGQIRHLSGVLLDTRRNPSTVTVASGLAEWENAAGQVIEWENSAGQVVQWEGSSSSASAGYLPHLVIAVEERGDGTTDLRLLG